MEEELLRQQQRQQREIEVQEAAIRHAAAAVRAERDRIIEREIKKVDQCDGADPALVRRWLKAIEMSSPELDNTMKVELITSTAGGALREELEAFLLEQPHRNDAEWADIRQHVLASFVSADHNEYQRTVLAQMRQLPGESVLRYNMRFRQAASEAFPGERTPEQQREIVRYYGAGLQRDSDAQHLVRDGWPQTIDQAFRSMANRETGEERYNHLRRNQEPMEVDAVQEVVRKPFVESLLEKIMTKIAALEAAQKVERRDRQRERCHNVPRTETQRAERPAPKNDAETRTCYQCGRMGHLARRCSAKRNDRPPPQRDNGSWPRQRRERPRPPKN